MERKVALITGITGQDGSFLAEFLLEIHIPKHTRSLSGSLLGYKTIP